MCSLAPAPPAGEAGFLHKILSCLEDFVMRRLHLILLALLLVVATAACKKTETYNTDTTTSGTSSTDTSYTASDTGATGMTGMTGATGATLNDKDKDFVTSVGKGGKAEVELAQDALAHATNADVKSFAQKLVDDHTKANGELEQYATAHGVTLPSEIEGKAKEAKERLMKLTGKSFDAAFVKQMVEDHDSTIKAFEDESKNGTDADLKSWVDKTLPTLRDHLKMAQDLQKKVK
jgi:putative membrane protein